MEESTKVWVVIHNAPLTHCRYIWFIDTLGKKRIPAEFWLVFFGLNVKIKLLLSFFHCIQNGPHCLQSFYSPLTSSLLLATHSQIVSTYIINKFQTFITPDFRNYSISLSLSLSPKQCNPMIIKTQASFKNLSLL